MATPSNDLPLGAAAPDFSLADVATGAVVSRDSLARGGALLVMFLCRHCPFVVHVEPELARLGRDYAGKLGIAGVCANDATSHPEDSPSGLAEQARRVGFTFPYLHDESQAVARAYGAVCTPELFLFDKAGKLAYHGRLDESRPGRGAPTGADLRAALDAVLAGDAVTGAQHPAIGCSIKWK